MADEKTQTQALSQFSLSETDEGYLIEIEGDGGGSLTVEATPEQLDAIIDKFMDYARPGEVSLVPVHVSSVVDKAIGQFRDTKQRIDVMTAQIKADAEVDETARRLQTMPGIGPITASVLAATLPNVSSFRSARDLPAWLGLTPKPHSSGGKERPGSISKMGNRYIRRLLYLGAMGVISARRLSEPSTDWLGRLVATKPLKVAAIALANRMARAIWAMLKTGEAWRPA
mgnify:CR=1 FL=1